jgi:SAM-dependent methyltransferase
MRPSAIRQLLACPLCHSEFAGNGAALTCGGCGRTFPALSGGRVDFRPAAGESITYERRYSPASYARALDVPLALERPSDPPRNDFGPDVPVHLTAAQVSYLPTARPGQIAVDLGCGHGEQRGVLERLGYACWAIDYEGEAADDLVDAHLLPLRDGSVDLVMSIAVLEHLADPVRAASEVARILKPGGAFIGTVAFLEPFHDNSFFHCSHLGVSWVLNMGGFEVECVSPIPSWNVLRAQIDMEVGAAMGQSGRTMARALSAPFTWALEGYGALGRRMANAQQRYARPFLHARHAGAFFFVARRPAGGAQQASAARG